MLVYVSLAGQTSLHPEVSSNGGILAEGLWVYWAVSWDLGMVYDRDVVERKKGDFGYLIRANERKEEEMEVDFDLEHMGRVIWNDLLMDSSMMTGVPIYQWHGSTWVASRVKRGGRWSGW